MLGLVFSVPEASLDGFVFLDFFLAGGFELWRPVEWLIHFRLVGRAV